MDLVQGSLAYSVADLCNDPLFPDFLVVPTAQIGLSVSKTCLENYQVSELSLSEREIGS